MTKPPTCCDRWRGKPISSRGEVERQAQGAVGRGRARPRAPAGRRSARCSSPRRCRRAPRRHRPTGPSALPTSRIAERDAVADHGGGEPGAVAAVFLVDVLDHLLAPLVLEIDVDVGRLVARGADEALEQHVDARRIDRGDAEAIADRRIGRRAAPLAQDAALPGEAHDVVHGQEIAGVVEPLDQLAARARSACGPCRGCSTSFVIPANSGNPVGRSVRSGGPGPPLAAGVSGRVETARRRPAR